MSMAGMTPLQRRAERRARNSTMVDMNLVSLIDIFTILIFFLLSNSAEVELLPSTRAVKLPESTAQETPRETVVVVVSPTEISVQGHKVAAVADVMAQPQDLIEPLRAELDFQSQHRVVREDKQALKQAVTIMGDKDISYQLLRKVMVTCARANFSDVSFAVRRKNGA